MNRSVPVWGVFRWLDGAKQGGTHPALSFEDRRDDGTFERWGWFVGTSTLDKRREAGR